MKYKKFIIKGYRGISGETILDLSKESLIPIIGKNESGKTTCLEAINAFDFNNDKDNNGKHLENIENLYSTIETPLVVAAEIEVERDFSTEELFKLYFNEIEAKFKEKYPEGEFNILEVKIEEEDFPHLGILKAYRILMDNIKGSKPIVIERDLRLKEYRLPTFENYLDHPFQNKLGELFVKALPYILYFDDFRDRMPEKILISENEESALYSTWIPYVDELFKQTRVEYSVFKLLDKQDSIRRSIIGEVQKVLNSLLIKEWSKYQFENSDDIKIKIEYETTSEGAFLLFKIVENVIIEGNSEERFFDISDRSKGFFWYFNFMFKLHFNPSKRDNDDVDTIYLLDEPGSYLHTYALNKLAEQLQKLSQCNKVIYCTHFHNLLNPEFIPINSIRIAEKINQGKIVLKRLDEGQLIRPKKNSAFQPILDALEVKPPLVEYDFDNVILLEGIYDFYSFKMFTSDSFAYFPCVSASSIINQVPYMIFLGKKYLALWDNDSEGQAQLIKAKTLFGEAESRKFMVLNSINDSTSTRLEDYYDQREIADYTSNYLKSPYSFNKMILQLFYSSTRDVLINTYFSNTKKNFMAMDHLLKTKIDNIYEMNVLEY